MYSYTTLIVLSILNGHAKFTQPYLALVGEALPSRALKYHSNV